MKKTNYDSVAYIYDLPVSTLRLRKIVDSIRGKDVADSLKRLKLYKQIHSISVYKVLHSAYSNALNKNNANKDMIISFVVVNEGSKSKRFRARARGRAFSILKKSSHICVGLKYKVGS